MSVIQNLLPWVSAALQTRASLAEQNPNQKKEVDSQVAGVVELKNINKVIVQSAYTLSFCPYKRFCDGTFAWLFNTLTLLCRLVALSVNEGTEQNEASMTNIKLLIQ